MLRRTVQRLDQEKTQSENSAILLSSLPHWDYLQHPDLDVTLPARPHRASGGLRLFRHSAGKLLQQDDAMSACVCVLSQCGFSSEFTLNLNEFPSVLGSDDCSDRPPTVRELALWNRVCSQHCGTLAETIQNRGVCVLEDRRIH